MKSVGDLTIEEIFDIQGITKVFNSGELNKIVQTERELEVKDYINCQQGLEISVSFLAKQGRLENGFPPNFLQLRNKPGFNKKLKNFLKNYYEISLPTKQIAFSLEHADSKFKVAKVHLADLTDNRWALIDILLQKNVPLAQDNLLNAEYEGLGGGVFDKIIKNIEHAARDSGVTELCLMAYLSSHRSIFEKRGYCIIPATEFPEASIKLAHEIQMSFPMWKKL